MACKAAVCFAAGGKRVSTTEQCETQPEKRLAAIFRRSPLPLRKSLLPEGFSACLPRFDREGMLGQKTPRLSAREKTLSVAPDRTDAARPPARLGPGQAAAWIGAGQKAGDVAGIEGVARAPVPPTYCVGKTPACNRKPWAASTVPSPPQVITAVPAPADRKRAACARGSARRVMAAATSVFGKNTSVCVCTGASRDH